MDDSDRNIVGSKPTIAELVSSFVETGEFETDPVWVVRWTLNQFARNDFDTFDHAMPQRAVDQ